MPELLLELGCEELPASFVRKAYTDLQAAITTRLAEAGLSHGDGTSIGTPRRLIVSITDLAPRQEDQSKEVRGPAIGAAFDAEGKPTRALEGFCRGQGASVDDVKQEGGYAWVVKHIPGRPTGEVLQEILPASIKSLAFDKTMRWGSSRFRFARPIRWVLAAFDGQHVPFEIEDIKSGTESCGHRFNAPEPFKATTYDELVNGLIARQVEPDAGERENRIREGATVIATGDVMLPDALVDENVFLTEWPSALEGQFKEEYLELPEPVLITTMAKHERFFPVRGRDGKLTNRFVSIRNGGEDNAVREGNQWVLNARFNDSKFFFDEDKKRNLAEFLEMTSGILFQEKLGNVRARADRLSALAAEVAAATGGDPAETDFARNAGLYAKADLSSGLVGELPELQGLIGGEYARREGMADEVAWAIASQYDLTKNKTVECPGARTAMRLMIADQLDKLAGFLALGQAPSGSSDPNGLRRAATILIEIAWKWPALANGYRALASKALLQYDLESLPNENVFVQELPRLFGSRYESLIEDARHDILEAALLDVSMDAALNPRQVRMRVAALAALADDTKFIQTATRPLNIVAAAEKKDLPFSKNDPRLGLERSKLDSATGEKLADMLQEVEQPLYEARQKEDAPAVVALLRKLEGPINDFFDSTMVMVDEPEVRFARLTLLNAAREQLLVAGDFSKLVIQGE